MESMDTCVSAYLASLESYVKQVGLNSFKMTRDLDFNAFSFKFVGLSV